MLNDKVKKTVQVSGQSIKSFFIPEKQEVKLEAEIYGSEFGGLVFEKGTLEIWDVEKNKLLLRRSQTGEGKRTIALTMNLDSGEYQIKAKGTDKEAGANAKIEYYKLITESTNKLKKQLIKVGAFFVVLAILYKWRGK